MIITLVRQENCTFFIWFFFFGLVLVWLVFFFPSLLSDQSKYLQLFSTEARQQVEMKPDISKDFSLHEEAVDR